MLLVIICALSIILLLVPVFVTIPMRRKYGNRGFVVLSWVICSLIYYVAFFNASSALLDHYFPLHSETKTVCEVKTTYSREGLF